MKVKVINKLHKQKIQEGSIVEVIPGMQADASSVYNIDAGMCYLCKDENGTLEYIPATFVEIIDASNTDWQQVRINAATAILQGIMSNPNKYLCQSREEVVDISIKTADYLIEQLQLKN